MCNTHTHTPSVQTDHGPVKNNADLAKIFKRKLMSVLSLLFKEETE